MLAPQKGMPPPPHQRMRRCKAAIKPVCACCSLLASLPTMQPNYQHNRGCVTSQNFNYTGWSAADSERHSTRNGDSLLEKTNSLLKAPQGRKHDDTTIGWDRVSGIWMQTESERCQHRTRQLTCLHTFYSASQLQIVISGNTQQLKQNTRKCKAQKLPWWFAKLRSGFHIFDLQNFASQMQLFQKMWKAKQWLSKIHQQLSGKQKTAP